MRKKMSFERFSTSDIYMFEHVGGFIECCGCWFGEWDQVEPFPQFKTPREALSHLDTHEKAGHDTGNARNRIMQEYSDLDIEIQPWRPTPEYEARHKKLMDDIKARFAAYEHPPQQFRDRSNGE
jgi:hypothetical protein